MPHIKHGSLALPGFWRIVWFGKLDRIPSPSASPRIKAYLWELPRWPNLSKGERAVRYLNIGEMPLLHLNTILKDGIALPHDHNPWVHSKSLSLDLSRDNLHVFKRFDRDDRGDLIVPVVTDYLEDDPDANALFVGIGHIGDHYAYLIPCIEIFRFFYALSSPLTKSVLTGDFLDPDRHLWDVSKSRASLTERLAFLQLRKRMLDADVRHLAIFAFVDGALKRAQEVFLFAAGHTSTGESRLVRALPPFDGKMTFKAEVVNLNQAGRVRTLITQLISCDWCLPYARIDYLRDNDGRVSSYPDENRPISGWSRPQGPKPDPVTLVEGPGNRGESPWEIEVEDISARFPRQSKIATVKLTTENSETRSGRSQPLPPRPSSDKVTTGDLISSKDMIREALLSGRRHLVLPEEEIAADADPTAADQAFLQTAELLLQMQRRGLADVQIIRVTPKIAYWRQVLLNVCKVDPDDEPPAWLFIDLERKKPRLALIASMRPEGRMRYLIDFQRKRPRECSILVLWSSDETELPLGYLAQALHACQMAKQVSLAAISDLPISWGRLKHTQPFKGIDGPERLLRRVLETPAMVA
ncbi:hypothetical protein [Metallibacterium scheffleri]|uniref:hypothetical protein n=1 Tax=Metallibacterium scheffleri TaxID=993689 RepID=UPI00109F083A|nr:hypothetical protein [Metallibacterium scheffleri]